MLPCGPFQRAELATTHNTWEQGAARTCAQTAASRSLAVHGCATWVQRLWISPRGGPRYATCAAAGGPSTYVRTALCDEHVSDIVMNLSIQTTGSFRKPSEEQHLSPIRKSPMPTQDGKRPSQLSTMHAPNGGGKWKLASCQSRRLPDRNRVNLAIQPTDVPAERMRITKSLHPYTGTGKKIGVKCTLFLPLPPKGPVVNGPRHADMIQEAFLQVFWMTFPWAF